MKTISRTELEEWDKEKRSFALFDVLPEYEGEAKRELAENRKQEFLEKVAGLGVNKMRPIVLYEASNASIEKGAAANALERLGFNEVYCFLGPHAELYSTQHDD